MGNNFDQRLPLPGQMPQVILRELDHAVSRVANLEQTMGQLVQAHNSMAQALGNLIDALQRSPRVREAMAQDVAEREISQEALPVTEKPTEPVSEVEGLLAQA